VFKKLLTPVTIMFIPHNSRGSLRFNIPTLGLGLVAVLCLMGLGFMYNIVGDALNYEPTRAKLEDYQQKFAEIESTVSSLKMADNQFRQLFGLETKEEVLETMNPSDTGDLDMKVIREQINRTMDTVAELREYLSQERDLYMATPLGWPVKGWLTSGYGSRMHPIKKTRAFHSGLDIAARPGTPIRASADGIVIFSGRSGGNGNLVAIAHGFGYSTYYAHNKKNAVKVGDVVKRGDIIAYVGSTGSSTGPHVHYEVWKNGKDTNPKPYLKGGW
jgi:murein DD-endopeptidase MepM/ murein hydrolase activator NlpD